MIKDINHRKNTNKVFETLNKTTQKLRARESSFIEFKESFNWGSKDKYAKTMASFANNRGGYLIFGVSNLPSKLIGLTSDNFETLDEASITAYFNSLFSPEILYEKFVRTISGKKVGFIYTYESTEKPIIPIKNDGGIKEAEIYYRYNARNDKIKYPELKALFEETKNRERKSWMNLFEKVSKIGPTNAGIMDIVNGTIEGENNSLIIDSKLIPKLKFIREGRFSKKGRPTLKLIGDVAPVTLASYKSDHSNIRLTTDPTALAVREETILAKYPLDYFKLVNLLTKRYADFKTNPKFHGIKKKLMGNTNYSHPRLLDPSNSRSAKKDFYSNSIIKEFDKHYKKRKK